MPLTLARWTSLACASVLCGCSLNAKPEKPAVMAKTQVTAPVEGIRSAVLGQAQDAAESIERTADTIAALSSNPRVRTNALEWKLVATVDLQAAAVSRDPVVGLGELTLFALQNRAYLTTGQGRDLFGPQQGIAVATVDEILESLLNYVNSIAPPGAPDRWLQLLQPWADAHPIQSPYVGRVSIVTDSLANALAGDRSVRAAVGDIELSVRMLDARVSQMQQTLLKQVRWEAELMMADAARQPVVDSLRGQMGRLTTSVERVTGVTEGMPDLIDQQRIAAFQAITQERIAVLQAITAERQALLAALASERATVIAALHDERVATLTDAEATSRRLIDYTMEQRLELLVDHVLLRVFLGALILILLVLGAALVVVAVARRGGRFASS